jgi:hypothetical protein
LHQDKNHLQLPLHSVARDRLLANVKDYFPPDVEEKVFARLIASGARKALLNQVMTFLSLLRDLRQNPETRFTLHCGKRRFAGGFARSGPGGG